MSLQNVTSPIHLTSATLITFCFQQLNQKRKSLILFLFTNFIIFKNFRMDLNIINNIATVNRKSKSLIKLRDLPLNTPVVIFGMKIVTTKFGKTPIVELPEHSVFLPKRSLNVIETNLKNFSPGKYGLVFTGLEQCDLPHPIQNFKIVELPQQQPELA